MRRATDCLMDAGCLQAYSSEQSDCAGTVQRTSGVARTIILWHERSRQRRELRELADDSDLLRDTGLSKYDVQHEARKPFWRE